MEEKSSVWLRPVLALIYVAVELSMLRFEVPDAFARMAAGTSYFALNMDYVKAGAIALGFIVTFIPLKIAGFPMISFRRPVAMAGCWLVICAATVPMMGDLPVRQISSLITKGGFQACSTTGRVDSAGHPLKPAVRIWAKSGYSCP